MTKLQDLYALRGDLEAKLHATTDNPNEQAGVEQLNTIIDNTSVTGLTEEAKESMKQNYEAEMIEKASRPIDASGLGFEHEFFGAGKAKVTIFEEQVGMKWEQYMQYAPEHNKKLARSFVRNEPVEFQK